MKKTEIEKRLEKELILEAKKEGIERFVIGAVAYKDKQVLLLERPKDEFMGGYFELPSGKVEKEESLSQALRREIKEETGKSIGGVGDFLGHFDYELSSGDTTRQWTFAVPFKKKGITLTEHTDYRWVREGELDECKISSQVRNIIKKFYK